MTNEEYITSEVKKLVDNQSHNQGTMIVVASFPCKEHNCLNYFTYEFFWNKKKRKLYRIYKSDRVAITEKEFNKFYMDM
jgi:hypothetical protein